jgi:Fe-S oxidoreductase
VREALDLCVSCKGCRRECPTGVDMAKMKIEALYHLRRAHRLPLRDRLIAHLPRWAPRAARLPWVVNLRNTLPGAAALGELLLGFSARRRLPAWRRDTFLKSVHGSGDDAGMDADVVLFVDTFTNYFEPENATAAVNVLRAAGRRVHVARAIGADAEPRRPLCCGRTYLAAGLVDEAKKEARRVVAALAPHVERGAAIVGLEPSCLLSLRDEFLVMGLGEAAQRLSESAFLVEEYLAREHRAGRLDLRLTALPQKHALLHTHCHQKAFDAAAPVQQVLSLIPELEVEMIEASCCGMAGSFGYDAAHYDVSVKMAELALLPAVRGALRGTLLVADGTSCRHQIADLTRPSGRREAIHAIRVLERALSPRSA